jgi:hypothetical protein
VHFQKEKALNTNGSLGDNFTGKIEKIPTHQKFVEFCRRVSSNQVGIIRTMNKLRKEKAHNDFNLLYSLPK